MIDKREILETASLLSLQPSVVEKDYVLGWLLAGINAHQELAESWVFKGGTCLKKCFFETYRFSEDLDFTLREESHLEDGFLRRVLSEVVEWVADESGLTIPIDQLGFDIYDNPRGHRSCQGKVGYRGPVSPTSGGWLKIKLDLTADGALVLPSVRRPVFHPYSDMPADGIFINSYSYEEAFGEKMRALAERTRPRDLYDVINLYRHGDTRPSAALLRDVLTKKCNFKGIALPTMASLESHRSDLEAMWDSMLAHQLPVLPPVADFWSALPEDWRLGMMERQLILDGVHAALMAITAPRYFESERGFQGALQVELDRVFGQAGLPQGAIIEQEYQKKLMSHGLKIRPDIIIHTPFELGLSANRRDGNHAVIELKRRAKPEAARDDFQSLLAMLQILEYPLGIFVNMDAQETYQHLVPAEAAGRIACFAVWRETKEIRLNCG